MISLEEVRREVVGMFKRVHETFYSEIKVNYPDYVIIDIERQKDPFVSVDIDLSGVKRAAYGEREILVPGHLEVFFYSRLNTGMAESLKYTDMLTENLSQLQVGSVCYGALSPRQVQTFPDWKGVKNVIRFDIVAPLNGSDL